MKGNKPIGDLCDVPRRVAELIKNVAYKRLSAEIRWNLSQNGRTWPRVLKNLSLLGAEIPAARSLKDVEALYGMQAYAADLPPGTVKRYQGDIIVVPTMPVDGEGYDERFQKVKGAVGYPLSEDPTERCGTCQFFLGAAEPGSVGACRLVEDEIAADALCNLYEVREASIFEGRRATEEQRTMSTSEEEGWQASDEEPVMDDSDTARAEAGATLDALVRQHRLDHPTTSYEMAFTAVRAAWPDPVRQYACATTRHSDGNILHASADREDAHRMLVYRQTHRDASAEDAYRAVLQANPILAAEYLGVAGTPISDIVLGADARNMGDRATQPRGGTRCPDQVRRCRGELTPERPGETLQGTPRRSSSRRVWRFSPRVRRIVHRAGLPHGIAETARPCKNTGELLTSRHIRSRRSRKGEPWAPLPEATVVGAAGKLSYQRIAAETGAPQAVWRKLRLRGKLPR